MKKDNKIYAEITDVILKKIEEASSAEWVKPWIDVEGMGAAINGSTKKAYRGVNQMLLSMVCEFSGWEKNTWLTFKQAKELGGTVLKGSSSSPVFYWSFCYNDPKTGKKYKADTDFSKVNAEIVKRLTKAFFGRYSRVFNVAQIEGLADDFYKVDEVVLIPEKVKNEMAEDLLFNVGADITVKNSNKAYYRPSTDSIVLPSFDQFTTSEGFYKTAFHELGHWTGAEHRCNRDMRGVFGGDLYAFEELIAELSSVFIGFEKGFNVSMTNNIGYLKGWLKALKNDPQQIMYASQKAQKACDFIYNEYDKHAAKGGAVVNF